MRFGVCTDMSRAQALASAGYDYIELSAAGDLVPEADEATWREKRRQIEALPLPVEAFMSFVRSGKIVGPEADWGRLKRYVPIALERAGQVGGKIMVFGSGGARNVPEGFDPHIAMQQIKDFLHLCADVWDKTGVIVVIEPLHQGESNIINRVVEGAELARQIQRPGVQNLADTFHMKRENEPLTALVATQDVLAHAHTADTQRLAPGTGQYDHISFFGALRDACYNARVSIECTFGPDFEGEMARALVHLQAAYAAANNGDLPPPRII